MADVEVEFAHVDGEGGGVDFDNVADGDAVSAVAVVSGGEFGGVVGEEFFIGFGGEEVGAVVVGEGKFGVAFGGR